MMQSQHFSQQNHNYQGSKTSSNQFFFPISKHLSKSLHISPVSESKTQRDFTFKNLQFSKYQNQQSLVDHKFLELKKIQTQLKQPKTSRNSLQPYFYQQPHINQSNKNSAKPSSYQTKHHRTKSNHTPNQSHLVQAQPQRYSHAIESKINKILLNSDTDEKNEKAYRRGLIQDTKRAVLQFNQDNLQLLNDIKKLKNKVSRRASPTKSPIPTTRPTTPIKIQTKKTISTDYSSNSQPYCKVSNIQKNLKNFQQAQSLFKFDNPHSFSDQDFLILKQLGVGNFAQVFLAVEKRSGFLVTLKKIKKSLLKNKKCEDQLMTEIKIQMFANHPNILKIYGCYSDDQTVTLILEFMQEGNLYRKIRESKKLSVDYASQSISQILCALKYLNGKKIVHRDIKPENVVISHGVRKLCDFGTAAVCVDRRSTVCGTLDYTAPQLIEGQEYNEPLDLWSLGVMTYELLTGKPPFYHIRRKDTIKQIMEYRDGQINYPSDLSEESSDFIGKFLLKDPQKRMSIEQALSHKFIESHADQQTRELTSKYKSQIELESHKSA